MDHCVFLSELFFFETWGPLSQGKICFPFQLTSLIYVENFELKNSAIMEDKHSVSKWSNSQQWQQETVILCH